MSIIFFLIRLAIICTGKTFRITMIGGENLERAGERFGNVIFACWHNRSLLPMYVLRSSGVNAIVSRSRDGEFASRILIALGWRTVRGSTGKGGGRALSELIEKVLNGENAALNPDGPQGPKYRAHPGIVYLAAKTARPVVPIAYSGSRKIVLKSWDNFQIPMPFCRIVYAYGEPVYVSENGDFEEKRQEIECRLNRTTAEADEFFTRKDGGSARPAEKEV